MLPSTGRGSFLYIPLMVTSLTFQQHTVSILDNAEVLQLLISVKFLNKTNFILTFLCSHFKVWAQAINSDKDTKHFVNSGFQWVLTQAQTLAQSNR